MERARREALLRLKHDAAAAGRQTGPLRCASNDNDIDRRAASIEVFAFGTALIPERDTAVAVRTSVVVPA